MAVQTAAVAALDQAPPAPPPAPPRQQLSADGAMVPLVGGAWAEVNTLVIGTLAAADPPAAAPGPHATDRSDFSRLANRDTVTRLATVATHRRGVATAGTVVGVLDGSPWLQRLRD